MRDLAKRTLRRYIMTYISIALLVILMLIPIYKIAYDASFNTMSVEIRESLESNLSSFEEAIYAIQLYASGILENDAVTRMAYLPDDNHYHMALALSILSELNNQTIRHSLIFDDMFLLFRDSNYVLLHDSLAKKDNYFGAKLEYETMTQEEYERLLFQEKTNFIPMQRTRTQYRQVYGNAITLNYYGVSLGMPYRAVSFVIFEDRLLDIVLTPTLQAYGNITISDNNGNVYLNYVQNDFSQDDSVRFYTKSPNGFFQLEAYVANAAFEMSVAPVKSIVIAFCLFATIVAIAISSFYAVRIFRPMHAYLNYVNSRQLLNDKEYRSIENFMHNSIDRISAQYQNMNIMITQLQDQYRDALLCQIADGMPVSYEEMQREFGNDPIFSANYMVLRVYIKIDQSEGMPLTRIEHAYTLISNSLQHHFGRVFTSHTGAFFAVFATHDGADAYYELEQVAQELVAAFGDKRIRLLVSATHCGISSLRDAYGETNQMLRGISNLLPSENLVFCYDQINVQNAFISFGLFQPIDLYNLLLSGSDENLKAYMTRLLARYEEASIMRSRRANMLYSEIIDVYESVLMVLHANIPLREAMPDSRYAEVSAYLLETALTIRRMASQHDTTGQSDILAFIDENYCRSDLCLSLLADRFELSEAHVSRLIKASTGCPYSEYVETKRMKKAIELLNTTNMSINEISAALGYENQSTFFKAFKRSFQISPGNYRRNQKGQGKDPML